MGRGVKTMVQRMIIQDTNGTTKEYEVYDIRMVDGGAMSYLVHEAKERNYNSDPVYFTD